jgi:tRNA(Phe) wybutosine-synthesizing methylase Tyw3
MWKMAHVPSNGAPLSGAKKAEAALKAGNERLSRIALSSFKTAKKNVMTKLKEAIDFSPKGSIDAPVVAMVNYINSLPDLFTTSSCSGRIAVYTYSPSTLVAGEPVSNKGSGTWQYVNHGEKGPLTTKDLSDCLSTAPPGSSSYLKVEPLILHIQAATIESARRLHSLCMAAGYRESGIGIGGGNVSHHDEEDHEGSTAAPPSTNAVDLSSFSLVGKEKIIVAVRTTACSLEVPLKDAGKTIATGDYLDSLVRIANERFAEIAQRREKFERMLRQHYGDVTPKKSEKQQPTPSSSSSVACNVCGHFFPSKNAMFKEHLVAAAADSSEGKKVCPKSLLDEKQKEKTSAAIASSPTVTESPAASSAASAKKGPTPTSSNTTCSICGLSLPSRNKLFSHVQEKHPKKVTATPSTITMTTDEGTSAVKSPLDNSATTLPLRDEFGRELLPQDLVASEKARDASARFLAKIGWNRKEHAINWSSSSEDDGEDASSTSLRSLLMQKAEAGQIPEPGPKVGTTQLLAAETTATTTTTSTSSNNKLVATVSMSGWEKLEHHEAAPSVRTSMPSSLLQHSIARHGHTSTLLDEGVGLLQTNATIVAVFGGTSLASPPHGRTNELLLIDVFSGKFANFEMDSDSDGPPCPRTRHAAVAFPSGVFASSRSRWSSSFTLIHGGHNGPMKQLDDLWLLEVVPPGGAGAKIRWSRPHIVNNSSSGGPAPRSGHSMCLASIPSEKLDALPFVQAALKETKTSLAVLCGCPLPVAVLYGGRDHQRSFDDTWLLLPLAADTPSFLWVQVPPYEPSTTTSEYAGPGRRYYHAAAICSEGTFLVVHGGERSPYVYGEHGASTLPHTGLDPRLHGLRAQLLGDCHVLCLETFQWLPTTTASCLPSLLPRMSHSLVALPEGSTPARDTACFPFLIHGGHALEPNHVGEELLWITMKAQGPIRPAPYVSASYKTLRMKPTRPDVVKATRVRGSHPYPRSIPWQLRSSALVVSSRSPESLELFSLGGAGVVFAFGSHHSPSYRTTINMSYKLVLNKETTGSSSTSNRDRGSKGKSNSGPAVMSDLHSKLAKGLREGRGGGVKDEALISQLCPLQTTTAPSTAAAAVDGGAPLRVEWVSDVLVIPQGSMTHPAWSAASSNGDNNYWWAALIASHFNANRLARASEIDPLSKTRASRVQLLYPPLSAATATSSPPCCWLDLDDPAIVASCSGPGSQHDSTVAGATAASASSLSLSSPEKVKEAEGWLAKVKKAVHQASAPFTLDGTSTFNPGGWVKVKENGHYYFFDLTKTMFSSGNISEKQRIAELVGEVGRVSKVAAADDGSSALLLPGETVVDLFCGIGYWTLPLLLKSKNIAKVVACDWNPHSIACLRMNLVANGVDPTRYHIVPGDNQRLLEREPSLEHKADRVVLGLIPTSEPWWPLALRLLKTSKELTEAEHGGGFVWLHVHENVTDKRLDSGEWQEYLLSMLKGIAGDRWTSITISKVVKVKSFAPHVWHTVTDVKLS